MALDYEFGQPGCAGTASDFVSIFETNLKLLLLSISPVLVVMPALILFGRCVEHAGASTGCELRSDAPIFSMRQPTPLLQAAHTTIAGSPHHYYRCELRSDAPIFSMRQPNAKSGRTRGGEDSAPPLSRLWRSIVRRFPSLTPERGREISRRWKERFWFAFNLWHISYGILVMAY